MQYRRENPPPRTAATTSPVFVLLPLRDMLLAPLRVMRTGDIATWTS